MYPRLVILSILARHPDGWNRFLHNYGALALFALVLLQDVGVPTGLPGTALVLIGGYLVYSHLVNLHVAALAIAAGAFLGASGMFFLARYGGRPVVLRLGRFVGLTDKRLDAAAAALDRWGPPMLLITRVAPGTRVYMTIFAGISGWTYRRFALWTGIFVLLWSYTFVILGAALGRQAEPLGRFIGQFGISALVAIAVLGLVYYGLRYVVSHPRASQTALGVSITQTLERLRIARFFRAPADVIADEPVPAAAPCDDVLPAVALQTALPTDAPALTLTEASAPDITSLM